MSYTEADYRSDCINGQVQGGEDSEVAVALVVVGLSSERAGKEVRIRDDMIRVHIVPARRFVTLRGLGFGRRL